MKMSIVQYCSDFVYTLIYILIQVKQSKAMFLVQKVVHIAKHDKSEHNKYFWQALKSFCLYLFCHVVFFLIWDNVS